MSKFGFDPDEFRPSGSVRRVVESALRSSGAADTTLDYALRYVALGWYVLPVRIDKKPVDGYGLNSATNDPAVVRRIWGEQHPDAGIAVACEKSGLVVLDIDPRNDGLATLAELEAEHGRLYSAVAAATQGGGEHRFFRAEPDCVYPGTLGYGVDVKHRGYVVVEPSAGTEGVYRWLPERDPTRGSEPTEAPAPLAQYSRRGPAAQLAPTLVHPGSVVVAPEVYADLRAALRAIPPESPYPEWFAVLQGLSRLADSQSAYQLAHEWSTRSRKPGHTESALKQKWRSCMREPYTVNYQKVFYLADQHDKSWRGADNPNPPPAQLRSLEQVQAQALTLEELQAAQLNPRVVLPYMLYADVRTRIAAGGTGKTTVALYESIRLALGWELWGRQPSAPVRTVLVTREDSREILAARAREIMRALELDSPAVAQVLRHLLILDLSVVGFRISTVREDVVMPHTENLNWLMGRLREFRPDWLIMDPLVSFGVGEQRVNDAEQGLIEAMRILKNEFDCCVEGIHHSGKANAREKILDQYAGRGGSAMADGSRMVCVMQPLTADEFLQVVGSPLAEDESALVMALPKLSYCRPQPNIYIKRRGYHFEQVHPANAPSQSELDSATDLQVYTLIREAWHRNEPLTLQCLKNDYKVHCPNLKRDAIMEALGRLKRQGRITQHTSSGGRGAKALLEPIVSEAGEQSPYALPDPFTQGGSNA